MTRRGILMVAGVAVALALVLAMVAGGGGHEVDEVAYRAEVEQRVGHPISDWDAYMDYAEGICETDGEQFPFTVAAFMDGGDVGLLRTDVRYVCPDRLDELDGIVAGLRG